MKKYRVVGVWLEAVSVLSEYKNVFEIASEAVKLLESHLVNPPPPKQIGLFLEHHDESKDISSLYDHVRHDNLAISAVDVIAYATGAIALATYQTHGIRSATDPILEATPEVFEFALSQYRKLEKAKLAKPISDSLGRKLDDLASNACQLWSGSARWQPLR